MKSQFPSMQQGKQTNELKEHTEPDNIVLESPSDRDFRKQLSPKQREMRKKNKSFHSAPKHYSC